VEELDYLAVAGHNFGSTGITVSVEGRNGSSPDIWQVIVEAAAVEDDLPLVCRFSSQTLTHVRLHIQGGDEVPQAAVMYVGKLLVMERGIDIDTEHVPITYARRSTIVSGMSESGNFVGRTVLKEWRETTAVFEHFTPDWYREFLDPFIEASKETPFFYCWLPLDYPAETGYAWMTNDPQPETSPITRRVNVQLQMRGIA
jgi:hypothetical protein